jgi:cell wall-associated NlpC family hydrolase
MRAQIVQAARDLLGTPYVDQGRVPGPNGGTDCIGVLILVARACGFKPATWDVNGYTRHPDGSMLALLDEHAERVPSPQAGDLIAVSWGDARAHHVGIVADHPLYANHLSIIHAVPKMGGVVEHRLSFGRFMRLVAAYKFPGID